MRTYLFVNEDCDFFYYFSNNNPFFTPILDRAMKFEALNDALEYRFNNSLSVRIFVFTIL